MQEGNNVMEIKYLASHERIFSLISLNKRENDCKPTFLVKISVLENSQCFAKVFMIVICIVPYVPQRVSSVSQTDPWDFLNILQN